MKNISYTNSALNDNIKTLTLAIVFAVLFLSCQKEVKPSVQYYNIDSLLKQQIYYLTKVQAVLTKEVRLGNAIDTTVVALSDSTLWYTELNAFSQLSDMNKPINQGTYIVADGLHEMNSNLVIKSFTGNDKQIVSYVKLYYQNSLSKIRKIEGLIQDENSIYKNTRKLSMEFQIINNKPILVHYTIQGLQKMFLSDPTNFSIDGQIEIK